MAKELKEKKTLSKNDCRGSTLKKCLQNWLDQQKIAFTSGINVSFYAHWPLCNCRLSIELPENDDKTTKQQKKNCEGKENIIKGKNSSFDIAKKLQSQSVGKYSKNEFVQTVDSSRIAVWKDNIWCDE